MEKRTRIGIRGLGLLGSRIARAVHLSSDMDLTVGIAVPDKSLDDLIERAEFHTETRESIPRKMYLAVPRHIGKESDLVRKYNAQQSIIEFEGASQLCLRKHCDCVVDTAYPAGNQDSVVQQYSTFPGAILVQDGAFPQGVLFAPPTTHANIFHRQQGTLYRMSDCVLSGVIPLIHAFHEHASLISLTMVTQYNGREPDYLIIERAGAVYVRNDLRQKLQDDISFLYPEIEVDVPSVVQIPSLLHYQGTLTMRLSKGISRNDALSILANTPRIAVLTAGVLSTYQVNLARGMHDSLRPVLVFSDAVDVSQSTSESMVRIVFALYYRTVAALANLDAIRILCNPRGEHLNALDIMRLTDQEAGF